MELVDIQEIVKKSYEQGQIIRINNHDDLTKQEAIEWIKSMGLPVTGIDDYPESETRYCTGTVESITNNNGMELEVVAFCKEQ